MRIDSIKHLRLLLAAIPAIGCGARTDLHQFDSTDGNGAVLTGVSADASGDVVGNISGGMVPADASDTRNTRGLGDQDAAGCLDLGSGQDSSLSDVGDKRVVGSADASPSDGVTPQVMAISAGTVHTCALLADGSIACWGENQFGTLGDGTRTSSSRPVRVGNLGPAIAVSAGGDFTCALLTDRTVWCWGQNAEGQLGNGTSVDSLVPVQVAHLSDVKAIVAGQADACAVLSGGTVACWGSNFYGQLGDGPDAGFVNDEGSTVPVQVSSLVDAVSVIAGDLFYCALRSDRSLVCWGNNYNGELGNQTTASSSRPVPVAGLSNVIAAAGGARWTCAVLGDGTVECWGLNAYGELGNGSMGMDSLLPVPVRNLHDATAIASNLFHTCVLRSMGTVACWGDNTFGELGDGSYNASSVPVAVNGLYGVVAITAGSGFACALVDGGTVECWGYNVDGELGNGSTKGSSVPVLVRW